ALRKDARDADRRCRGAAGRAREARSAGRRAGISDPREVREPCLARAFRCARRQRARARHDGVSMYYGHNEPVTLSRDCPAVLIPAGETVTLPEGTSGFITQALGGSFTLYIEGNLFRIAGIDADALGMEPVRPPDVPEDATEEQI